jgi:release factor glutamine methyltransferase
MTELMTELTVESWLKQSRIGLIESGSESPRADAELLAQHVLQCTRTWLRTWGDQVLSQPQQSQLQALLERRLNGEPIAYLIGEQGFWSLNLKVSPATLIPRPDTETLVEWALALPLPEHARALDLGTGTGAIALALAVEREQWQVSGLDLMPEAVALARENAELNQLERVRFDCSNWFEAVEASAGFDLIVSNPPYIDPDDAHLEQGDVRFEPRSALVAEHQGMADLERIIDQSRAFLKPEGWLLLEHGYQQAEAVRTCLEQAGFQQVTTRQDFGGNPRISGGCWLGHTQVLL